MQEMWVRSLGQEDPQEKEMATHSSILAWEGPWTEEPGRLQSMGWERLKHDLATKQQQQITVIFRTLILSGSESAILYHVLLLIDSLIHLTLIVYRASGI